jgi:hypothetical protein
VGFAFYNGDPNDPTKLVDVNLIWMQRADVPLITVVFWSFVPGVLVSLFVFMSVLIKQSIQLRSSKRRIKALEGEVTALRNRPIEESAELLASSKSKPRGETPLFKDGK